MEQKMLLLNRLIDFREELARLDTAVTFFDELFLNQLRPYELENLTQFGNRF